VLMRIDTSAGLAVLMLVVMAAPSAAQTDQHGASYELDRPGRITVVDFAASWCVPCWKSLPHVEALAHSYPDIQFLVVSVDDREDGRD
ncbi:MAG: thioredoxin domain-containing protein, partial [bacterium]